MQLVFKSSVIHSSCCIQILSGIFMSTHSTWELGGNTAVRRSGKEQKHALAARP